MMATFSRLIVSAGLLLWVGSPVAYRVRDEHSLTKTLRFAGPGVHTLDVRGRSGAIHVSGYEGADVQLEATQTIAAENEEALQAAQRDVVLDTTDGAATITAVVRQGDRPECGESGTDRSRAWERQKYDVTIDLRIRVPRSTSLRLCTINGGEVRVEDTSGDFDLQNVNGRITLDRVRGAGRATTVNGRVSATFAETPPSASLFKTVNGGIVLTLPAHASADLRLKTVNGGIFTDFDVAAQAAKAEPPSSERRNGKYVYRSRSFTDVRIGRGGPKLTCEAFNGDVRVLRASR
jgi:hypothetical protein